MNRSIKRWIDGKLCIKYSTMLMGNPAGALTDVCCKMLSTVLFVWKHLKLKCWRKNESLIKE